MKVESNNKDVNSSRCSGCARLRQMPSPRPAQQQKLDPRDLPPELEATGERGDGAPRCARLSAAAAEGGRRRMHTRRLEGAKGGPAAAGEGLQQQHEHWSMDCTWPAAEVRRQQPAATRIARDREHGKRANKNGGWIDRQGSR
ncbi:unnamed protein product [Urochloa humidicola]